MIDTIKFAREISPDVEVIENKSHWTRDVVLEEDAYQVRWSVIPQVMNTLRSTALAALRFAGYHSISKAMRYFAAHPQHALRLINRKTRTMVDDRITDTFE